MNALIVTDLSPAGLASVESIGACGPSAFDRITLLHVIDLDPYTAGGSIPQISEWAAGELEKAANVLRDRWFDVDIRIEQGDTVEMVDFVADDMDADLIAMTNVGKGAVSGRLLGSTAEKLASGSRHMVLVEKLANPNEQWCRLGTGSPFETLVAGVDDVFSAGAFVKRVSSIPGVAKLVLVHVLVKEEDRDAAARALGEHAASAPGLVDVDIRVVAGDPAEALIAEADRVQATAIVVAPVSRGILRRGVLGSVSHSVLSKSSRSVVLLPHI